MPQDTSTSGRKTKSRRRNKPTKDHDSTKTHRGSPVPQSPDISDPNGSSTGAYVGQDGADQYLLGFGAQFDNSK
ncbi:hypothetical protein F4818DRAFT_206563 [Hypoxylon cercidicola]|nr:hypothetical protein F4818DRAFT_206563 [Hypoxylon cercidicola]